MNRRRVGVFLIAIGIILGLAVAGIVFANVKETEDLRAQQPKRLVAVAAADVPERTTIGAEQVGVARLPENAVPPGSVSQVIDSGADEGKITEDFKNQLKEQFTPARIYKGEVINKERLGKDALKNTPSFEIAPGKVAYAFPVRVNGGNPANERVLVALLNAVRAGDFVDIYYSTIEVSPNLPKDEAESQRSTFAVNNLYTRRILQNIRVMQVGFFPDATGKAGETGKDERFLTLEVTPSDSLVLKWLKDAATLTGNIDFVLRSPVDTQPFPSQTIDYSMMQQQYQIGTGR